LGVPSGLGTGLEQPWNNPGTSVEQPGTPKHESGGMAHLIPVNAIINENQIQNRKSSFAINFGQKIVDLSI
jgi:hypothetical protein